jgi:hypothetical protein
VHNFIQREGNQTLSIMQISRVFGRQPIRVKIVLDNGLDAPKVRDRHMAVDENSEAEILERINSRAEKCNPIPLTEFWHYCEVKCSISIS